MHRCSLCLLLPLILSACAHSPTNAMDISPPLEHQNNSRESTVAEAIAGDLQYFIGTWLATAEDPSTGQAFTLRYQVEPALGGTWLSGAAESAGLGIEIRDMWGRDAVTDEIVRIIFQSDGNYGTVRSQGWDGDMLRLEGEVRTNDGVLQVRETITRLGPGEFRAVWEALLDGSWTTYSIEHLTRQSPS